MFLIMNFMGSNIIFGEIVGCLIPGCDHSVKWALFEFGCFVCWNYESFLSFVPGCNFGEIM